jgi:hypothetical protein
VQWDFGVFPVNQDPPAEPSCLAYTSETDFDLGQENNPGDPSELDNCYGRWAWRSCTDGNNITVGGQVAIGTVFSRYLDMYDDLGAGIIFPGPGNPASWDRVDAWVKFRVNAVNINRFGRIFFSINDGPAGANICGLNGQPPRDWMTFPALALNAWIIVHAFKVGNWEGWESRNLRAVLSVMGTQMPINVGWTHVDVEWFAFRLSEEIAP